MRSAVRLQPNRPAPSNGFGLVELLVASAVGALLVITVTTIFVPELRLHQRLEGRIRLQERWARLHFLLDTEIQQAHTVEPISNGLRLIICEPQSDPNEPDTDGMPCSDGSANGTPGTSGTDVTIDYVWDSGQQTLSRSGPGIDCRGGLRVGGQGQDCSGTTISDNSDTSVVITGVIAFSPVVTNQSVRYSISLRDPLDPNGSTFNNQASSARAHIKKL